MLVWNHSKKALSSLVLWQALPWFWISITSYVSFQRRRQEFIPRAELWRQSLSSIIYLNDAEVPSVGICLVRNVIFPWQGLQCSTSQQCPIVSFETSDSFPFRITNEWTRLIFFSTSPSRHGNEVRHSSLVTRHDLHTTRLRELRCAKFRNSSHSLGDRGKLATRECICAGETSQRRAHFNTDVVLPLWLPWRCQS